MLHHHVAILLVVFLSPNALFLHRVDQFQRSSYTDHSLMSQLNFRRKDVFTMEKGNTFFRTTLVPLFLMVVSPPAVQFVWIVCHHHYGSVLSALRTPASVLWQQFPTFTLSAATMTVAFLTVQLFLLIFIPGPIFTAIPTPMGNLPKYTLNGVPAFFITHLSLALAHNYGLIRYGALYDSFGEILAFLNKIALVVTLFLYVRGIYYPTNSDSGTTGYGFIWDIWHGTELHPEVFGVSLKQLINCRFAMMGWSVAVIAFAAKQRELYGSVVNSMVVSTLLQMVYILKFFIWEGGYFNSVRVRSLFVS